MTFDRTKFQAEAEESRAAYRASRTAPHNWPVGKILVRSWGYDQTNIDYYEVTAVHGPRVVTVRKIASDVVRSCTGADYVMPQPRNYVGEAKRCTVNYGHVKVGDYSGTDAYPWDGKENYETASGWGH
jgi:hypothetical protein